MKNWDKLVEGFKENLPSLDAKDGIWACLSLSIIFCAVPIFAQEGTDSAAEKGKSTFGERLIKVAELDGGITEKSLITFGCLESKVKNSVIFDPLVFATHRVAAALKAIRTAQKIQEAATAKAAVEACAKLKAQAFAKKGDKKKWLLGDEGDVGGTAAVLTTSHAFAKEEDKEKWLLGDEGDVGGTSAVLTTSHAFAKEEDKEKWLLGDEGDVGGTSAVLTVSQDPPLSESLLKTAAIGAKMAESLMEMAPMILMTGSMGTAFMPIATEKGVAAFNPGPNRVGGVLITTKVMTRLKKD